MTLQVSSFPLVKLSFRWLNSIQGKSLPQHKCPTAPFSSQICHFPHVEVVGTCWFCSPRGKLCCTGLFVVSSHNFLPLEWMVLEGNIELFFREFVNLPTTVSQGLAAKHARHVDPVLFRITWDVILSFGLCVLWNPLAPSEGPLLRCKLYYPSSFKFTLEE